MPNNNLTSPSGFTLIELAVVAAILVILAVTAMSAYSSSNQIEQSFRSNLVSVAGAISSAARAKRADQIALGNTNFNEYGVLDNRANGSTASESNTMFFNYVSPPIVDNHWEKLNKLCYRFDQNRSGTFEGNDYCLYWDNATGTAGAWSSLTTGNAYCSASTCANPPWVN